MIEAEFPTSIYWVNSFDSLFEAVKEVFSYVETGEDCVVNVVVVRVKGYSFRGVRVFWLNDDVFFLFLGVVIPFYWSTHPAPFTIPAASTTDPLTILSFGGRFVDMRGSARRDGLVGLFLADSTLDSSAIANSSNYYTSPPAFLFSISIISAA